MSNNYYLLLQAIATKSSHTLTYFRVLKFDSSLIEIENRHAPPGSSLTKDS